MMVSFETVLLVMKNIREVDFPQTKQVEVFIEMVKEHFEEERGGE